MRFCYKGDMRAVALSLSIALLGCFPHNAKLRTASQLAEGAAIVTGIVMEYFVNSDADCQQMQMLGMTDTACKSKGAALGDVGLGLILAGIGGFILTISTKEDDKPAVVELKPQQPDKPAIKLPPGVQPQPTGSAAPSRPAP